MLAVGGWTGGVVSLVKEDLVQRDIINWLSDPEPTDGYCPNHYYAISLKLCEIYI